MDNAYGIIRKGYACENASEKELTEPCVVYDGRRHGIEAVFSYNSDRGGTLKWKLDLYICVLW